MSGPDRAMPPKAPDAFRTISEVGEDLGLPQHVLRFWETRFPAIRPLKRGGGRRYYRPDDVDLLRGIQALLYGQGYTIRGVQRILKQGGPRAVQAIGRGEPADIPSRHAVDADGPEGDDAVDMVPEASRPDLPPGAAARLRAVLDDLEECRRLLGAARSASDE